MGRPCIPSEPRTVWNCVSWCRIPDLTLRRLYRHGQRLRQAGRLQRGSARRVVGADVDESELANTVETITSAGGQAIGLRAEVTNVEDLSAMVQAAQTSSRCISINLKGVLNGITGVNSQKFFERFGGIMEGSAPAAWSDPNHIEYFMLAPEELADQIIYVINQPWGVSISDITVRASGDLYVI
jgi:hypothetical protein